jgi:retinol dehydrogenase-12
MHGVAVVTGGSSGVGLATVELLVAKGFKVFIGCRNVENGKFAVDRISKKYPQLVKPEVDVLDLSSLESVKAFAATISSKAPEIKLLINNAAYIGNLAESTNRAVTDDGLEMTFATNHLGHYALTAHLMPNLLRASPSRVVVVSALGHRIGTRPLMREDLQLSDPQNFSPTKAYVHTKLMNILFARELNTRYADQGVTAVSAHPGIILDTKISRNVKAWWVPVIWPLVWVVYKAGCLIQLGTMCSSETAAQGLLAAAEHPLAGGYFEVGQPTEPSTSAMDASNAAWLWDESSKLADVRWP